MLPLLLPSHQYLLLLLMVLMLIWSRRPGPQESPTLVAGLLGRGRSLTKEELNCQLISNWMP